MIPQTTFSPCRKYRYVLLREWHGLFSEAQPGEVGADKYVNFICLNPSTADETKNDPTIRRCIGFATSWGFQRFVMTNLFAYRSTDPTVIRLLVNQDPVGADNLAHVLNVATGAALVVCAWGVRGVFQQQDAITVALLRNCGLKLHCLRTTAQGFPEHPLYLPKELTAIPFAQFAVATA